MAVSRRLHAPWGRSDILALTGLLTIALLLRLIPVFIVPGLTYADEILQTVEQAHRLVYGRGFVPWEFEYGIRSWILPGLFAAVLQVARPFGERPEVYLPVVGIFCAAISLVVPLAAYVWARQRYDRNAAILAGLLPAVWVDLVYFAPRTLSEPIAGHALLAGLLLADDEHGGNRRRFAAGAVLGLALLLRFHFAPAIVVATGYLFWRHRGLTRPLLLGAGVVILLGGLLDTLTWTYPWQSIWLNFRFNVLHGVSHQFGVEPWYWYIGGMALLWSGGVAVIWGLALLGAGWLPVPLIAAVTMLASHSMIEHKEYRFLYPAVACLMVTAGIGIARLVDGRSLAVAWGAAATIALTSLATTITPIYQDEVWPTGADSVALGRWVRQQRDLCGLGVVEGFRGGHTHLHLDAPIFEVDRPEQMAMAAPGFNVLLYDLPFEPPAELGFSRAICFHKRCAATRGGGCEPVVMKRGDWRPKALRDVAPWRPRFAAPSAE